MTKNFPNSIITKHHNERTANPENRKSGKQKMYKNIWEI